MKPYVAPKNRKKRGSDKKTTGRIKFYFAIGFAALLLLLTFKFSLTSETFAIKNIRLEGQKEIAEAEIINKARAAVLQGRTAQMFGINNILAWPRHISIDDPRVQELEVRKNYFQQDIVLRVQERKRFGIWCSGGVHETRQECYWFDKNGIVLDYAPSTDGSLIFKVVNLKGEELIIGTHVLREDHFRNIKSILVFLEELGVVVLEYAFDETLQEFSTTASEGPRLLFSVRFEPTSEIFDYLKSLINNDELQHLQYVDFTVKDRIYTK